MAVVPQHLAAGKRDDLEGLLLLLVASGYLLPVFAYARPMPVNPSSMRNPERGMRWYALAGLPVGIVQLFGFFFFPFFAWWLWLPG